MLVHDPAGAPEPFGELRRALGGRERTGWIARLRPASDEDDDAAGDETRGVRQRLLTSAGLAFLGAAVTFTFAVLRTPAAPSATSGPEPAITTPVEPGASLRPGRPAAATGSQVWPGETPTVEGNVVTAGDQRWVVGDVGDVVAVGDWDCNGTITPAALRAASGLFVFDDWADAGAERRATKVADVRDGVGLTARGCGFATLTRPDGTTFTVETHRG